MKSFKYILAVVALIGVMSCGNTSNTQQTEEKQETALMSTDNLLDGQFRAIAYSGFRTGQHPDRGNGAVLPSYEEILEDLQILTKDNNFTLIRLYDCGENSRMVLETIEKHNINVKVLLGMWLDAEISNHEGCPWLSEAITDEKLAEHAIKNREELNEGIRLANKYSEIIVAVNVGNEALVEWNDHMVTVDSVISYVKQVKAAIEQPVTVADNYDWWVKKGADLAQAVDFLSIHVYPAWVGKDIDEGLSHTIENTMEVYNAFPNKQIVITEAGWASIASEFGLRASQEKQLRYYNEVMDWAEQNNITTFFFEAFDEDWKGNPDNPQGAEKHWGIFTVDRKPKKVMQALYPEL